MIDPNDLTTPIYNEFMEQGLLKLQELYRIYHTNELARKAIDAGADALGRLSPKDSAESLRLSRAATAAMREAMPLYEDLQQTIGADPQLRANYLNRVQNASNNMLRAAQFARATAPAVSQAPALSTIPGAVRTAAPIVEEGVQAVEGQAPGAWNAITQGARNVGAWVPAAVGFLGGRTGRLALGSVAAGTAAAGGIIAAKEYGIPGVIGPNGKSLPLGPASSPGPDSSGTDPGATATPASVPAGKKIVNVSYTAMPGSDMPIAKLNYADGSSRAVAASDPELRAYEDSLPNRGPGIIGSVTSALSGAASAVAGAFAPGPATVIVTPDGKVQPAPGNGPEGRSVPAPVSGAPAFTEDTRDTGSELAKQSKWDPSLTSEAGHAVRDQEAAYRARLDDLFTAGITRLRSNGRSVDAEGMINKRAAAQNAYDAASANLADALLNQQMATGLLPKRPAEGASAEELVRWQEAQSQGPMNTRIAATAQVTAAREKKAEALEKLLLMASAPGIEASTANKLERIDTYPMPVTNPDGSTSTVNVLAAYDTVTGRLVPLRWDDRIGAPRAVKDDGSDGEAVEVAGVAVDGNGTVLRGMVGNATGGPVVPQAVPGGAPKPAGAAPAAPAQGGPIVVMPGPKAPIPSAASQGIFAPKANTIYRENGLIVTISGETGKVIAKENDPAYDPNSGYKPNFVKNDDGSIDDIQRDLKTGAYRRISVQPPDPEKIEAAKQARLTGEVQRVAAGNTQLANQYTLARQAATDENTRNIEAYDNKRKDLEGKIKASSEERKRQVLDLVAQKKLTLPQALSILHDQQGLATAMATEQQKWEQQRAQRMAEKDKGLAYAQSLDKDIGFGNALLSLRSDPQAEDIKRRYAADISTLPGNAGQSVGVRLAQQRGYSGISYDDPGVWQQPNVDVTPEALAGMGVGADPTDAFYAAYRALEQPVMKPMPTMPTFMPMPTGAPAAQVAPLPAAVGGWGAGLGRFEP